jgi:hypothetical protein
VGRGFWTHAYKDTNILVEGSMPLILESISLIEKFHYFNSIDKR